MRTLIAMATLIIGGYRYDQNKKNEDDAYKGMQDGRSK